MQRGSIPIPTRLAKLVDLQKQNGLRRLVTVQVTGSQCDLSVHALRQRGPVFPKLLAVTVVEARPHRGAALTVAIEDDEPIGV